MKKLVSVVSAMAMTGVLAVSSAVPVQAQSVQFSFGQRDRVISTYCDRNPRDRDCREFRRGNFDRDDYRDFYSSRRSGLDNIASGLFGFTFGAIIGGAIANSNNNRGGVPVYRSDAYERHVDACYARFRSYDVRTDTYLGYDGYRHRCTL